MKLKSLTIRRTESYQTPANALVGTVDLLDEGGAAMTVTLSGTSIIKILEVVQQEVQLRAVAAARQAGSAMQEACAEITLQEHPMLTVEEE